MIIRVMPLEFRTDFDRSGAVSIPKDPLLHDLTCKFAEQAFVEQPNLAHGYAKVWVAAEVDQEENPVSVQGVIGYQLTPDITLLRALSPKALCSLTSRMSSFFSDNGARGMPVLVFVRPQEDPRQLCPDVEETLKAWKAVPANRWEARVK